MSEQIVLPGFSGDVVLVNGLCYEFAGYTIQPSEDLDIEAKFETCDECGLGVPAVPSSSSESSSSGSSIPEPVRCNDCDPQLADTYTIALSGLVSPFSNSNLTWNGSHTIHWNAAHPFFGGGQECGWQVIELPGAEPPATASLGLTWNAFGYPDQWSVKVMAFTFTWLDFEGPTDPCDPRGPYGAHVYCNQSFGAPHCDAQDFSATTCTVS